MTLGLSVENLTDGFYSRMMGFESDDDDPEPQQVLVTDVPDTIVDVARHWGDFNPGGNLSGENPHPLVVEYTPGALEVTSVFLTG